MLEITYILQKTKAKINCEGKMLPENHFMKSNFQIFHLFYRASGLGLISSMKLDGRMDIRSVKSVLLILHSEL